LQRTADDITGFFDVIGGQSNYTLGLSFTVTGLITGNTYRFRYRAVNAVGFSGWSPITLLQPASTPSTPVPPIYVSSTNDDI